MATDDNYEYRDLLASTWDLLRGDMADSPDQPFFQRIIQDYGQPALDVGCGTGRLLLDYLADGLQVEGVDVSPEMVALCRQKALELSLEPTVYVQAIEALDVPTRYRTIIVPSYTFQLLPDLADARAALDRFHDHLLPGGTLVVSIWHSKRDGPAEWSDWYFIAEKERPQDGLVVKRQERSMYDPETQLRYTENRYELLENDQVVYAEDHRRSPELRNYTLAQISDMLDQAGFTVLKAVADYPSDLASAEPATEEDTFFCIIGQRE
jgi:ubiquinone/menaquinone biosynthesis C-methylase UbiE